MAARGREHDLDRTLRGRAGGVRLRVDGLELDQPGAEEGQHHRDEHEPEPQPDHR